MDTPKGMLVVDGNLGRFSLGPFESMEVATRVALDHGYTSFSVMPWFSNSEDLVDLPKEG
jgi:hypothetical protein